MRAEAKLMVPGTINLEEDFYTRFKQKKLGILGYDVADYLKISKRRKHLKSKGSKRWKDKRN